MESAVTTRERRERRDSPGFTLIELVVTMAVAGVLAAIAVPAMQSFLQNDRLLNEANSLVWSLDTARSEAIKQDAGVQVCASSDGHTCNGTDWAKGWIVLAPSVADRTILVPLQVVPALTDVNTLTEKIAGAMQITFLASGMTDPAGAPAVAFTLCDSRGAVYARYVQVQSTGRVASSAKGLDPNGNPLTCP